MERRIRRRTTSQIATTKKMEFLHLVLIARRQIISPQKCWWRPDVKCNKCGKQGHVERICKNQ